MRTSTPTMNPWYASAETARKVKDRHGAPSARNAARLSVATALFSVLVIVVAWVFVGAVLRSKWLDTIEAQTHQNTNLAAALTEQALRVLATIDHATLRTAEAVAAAPGVTPDLVRFANETGLAPTILAQLSLIDASGKFVGSNLDPDGSKSNHVDLSTREHVKVHLNPAGMPAGSTRPSANGLFVGKPVLGKVSSKWTIQVTRKIAASDGTTLGVVVASLDPSYFEEVFSRVSVGATGGIAMIGSDLTVRARVVGGKPAGMGSTLQKGSALERYLDRQEGHYIAPSGVDQVDRIIAFRRIADYPIFLTVATGKEEALGDWRDTRAVMLGLTAFLSLVVIAAASILVLMLRRLERSNVALRASEAQAIASNQAKSEFLAAMSHELRTPLTSIRGFAELMEHRLDQPKFREQAGLIRKGAEYLNNLLTEILDLTKLEAGAMELHCERRDVRGLVEGAVRFYALSADEKGLKLSFAVKEGVPQDILCDGLRLKQVLNNLLSNAVKFTREGSIEVVVEQRDGTIVFHVVDTGPGVPVEMQDAIFEKFRQGNAKVSYEHGGTGLGLALSRSLAQVMRGTLTLASSPGRGARFTLTLPLNA